MTNDKIFDYAYDVSPPSNIIEQKSYFSLLYGLF